LTQHPRWRPQGVESHDHEIRGSSLASWDYIYVTLGFALAIEGTIIQMVTPLAFPCNIIAYVALGAFTFWLFLFSGRFQNWLLGIRKYESVPR
jgi:hypothetical protein